MSGRIAQRIEERPNGHVAFLRVVRPEKLNVLNAALMTALRDALRVLAEDDALRAVVIEGEGARAWIGGADIREMATLDAAGARQLITLLHDTCDAARRCPVPVVAAIRGWALGGGLELAASCDLRIATVGARFAMPEVRIGIPSVIEARLLPMLIGWGRARRLLLTGETIDAARAEAWGLVEEVVAEDMLEAAVGRVLDAILANAPRAVRAQKRLIAGWEEQSGPAAIAASVSAFAASFADGGPQARMKRALG